ncbi:MAG: TetR family transcriptional regulator [Acidimicrobiales bacterium]
MARTTRPAANAAGEETRTRLLEATLTTLAELGLAKASSRAIARQAGVNQALIFYHFGSYEGLVTAAARLDSERRAARYADRLADVHTLPELVAVARELHTLEREMGSLKVLAQLMAGASTTPDLYSDLQGAFAPWIDLVEAAVARALDTTPFGALIPSREAAITIASLFVGIELVADLDPATGVDRLLDFLTDAATLAGRFAVTPAAAAADPAAPQAGSSTTTT